MSLDIYSPCIGICKIKESTQRCSGCERTIDEITRWRTMDDEEKLAVLTASVLRRREIQTEVNADQQHSEQQDQKPAR